MRTVPEGVPFYRARGRSAVCPSCRTPIRRKKNSLNESLFSVQVIGLVVILLAGVYFSIWALAGAAIFIVASAVRIWHSRGVLKDWPRWNEDAR
jgi:hypothetical protein